MGLEEAPLPDILSNDPVRPAAFPINGGALTDVVTIFSFPSCDE